MNGFCDAKQTIEDKQAIHNNEEHAAAERDVGKLHFVLFAF